jgi:hypothetical protein
MGYADAFFKPPDNTGEKAQAADFGSFFAGLEESLHAETDSEERDAGANAVEESLADS